MFTLRDVASREEFYLGKVMVEPRLHQQSVELDLPVKGLVTVLDGHDYHSHHRRFAMTLAREFTRGAFQINFARYALDFVHIGEDGNTTYVKAPCLAGLVDELIELGTKPFVTDTSTLYTGRRHNAVDHAMLAGERGFGLEGLGIPFIAPDGLFGTAETAVEVNCPLHKEVLIAYDIVRCQSILSVAHFTGHCATGAGAKSPQNEAA